MTKLAILVVYKFKKHQKNISMFTRFYIFAFIALVGMAWLTPHLSSKPSQILKTRLQITIRN
ncbi:MAG: hypothetical protein K2Q22_13045, partial [Cytophagales bacterium]|nr:hypothetical protein [Cytophagales bacterium]